MSFDPFSRMHMGLVATLRRHPPLTAMVRLANWVDPGRAGQQDAYAKDPISTADLPEIEVRPLSWVARDHTGSLGNSAGLPITVTYEITVRSNTLNTCQQNGVNQLTWEVYRALHSLTMRTTGAQEVRYSWLDGANQGVGNRGGTTEDNGRTFTGGISGWHSVMQIRMTAWIPKGQVGIAHIVSEATPIMVSGTTFYFDRTATAADYFTGSGTADDPWLLPEGATGTAYRTEWIVWYTALYAAEGFPAPTFVDL